MRALVYHGSGQRSWDEVPDPRIQDDFDAIVGIDAVTICGTDLHILKGDVPEVTPGTVLGHEAVGTVEAVGSAVRSVRPGDRVLISCINGCGTCPPCREGRYGQCRSGGGWVLGHTIDGVQAEYARVPFADFALHKLPTTVSDEAAVMLADILPTSYEVGVLAGAVRPGDTVAIVGAGPIGLAAVMTSRLYSPGHVIVIDPVAGRLDAAKSFGADVVVRNGDGGEDAVRLVTDITDGLGADVVIEAVGTPGTFELCAELVAAGGHVANVGVHGAPATLHLESLWIKDVTITTGLVDGSTTPRLLGLVAGHQLDPSALVTQTFPLDQMMAAYDVFSKASETGALKVVCTKQ
jgi:alcohol dehydrogenase